MQEVLSLLYLWLKSAHIIFVVFWMAGLFMLPRQLLYAHSATPGSEEEALWIKRMGLLRKIILTPSMIIVWVVGLLLAFELGLFTPGGGNGWLHAKIAVVLLLTGFHGYLTVQVKKNARGERPLSEKQLRLYGEVPGILLVLIVILVVVKPF